MFSSDIKIASRGYHVYRNSTWQNGKSGDKVKVEIETNKSSKSIDPYTCAIKIKHKCFETWVTVGHIPMEISRLCYFFLKEGGNITGHLICTIKCQSISDSCRWFRGSVAVNFFR